ncbi:MAG: hypothetical protein GY906_24655 [bacterium]|nr:hypothetical protein [bacterium]
MDAVDCSTGEKDYGYKDKGDPNHTAVTCKGRTKTHPIFDDCDFQESFGPEGADTMHHGLTNFRTANPKSTVSLEPFCMHDVEEVYQYAIGENDGAAWLVVGKLSDGRYFFVSASCDYTGWGCRSGGTAYVERDLPTLMILGIDDGEHQRLRAWVPANA